MKPGLRLIAASLMISAASVPAIAEDTGTNVMFIFDSSGSMKKTISDGESRSDAAKRAMEAALYEMPASARLGLLMYGHRRAKDCTDIQLVAPFGKMEAGEIFQTIRDSKPKGETPIAAALAEAAKSFSGIEGGSNSIVLVTDGVEECSGDPCAAARAIRESGLGLKAHVVGFTLTAEQRATVQCVADETGGKYIDAQNAEALTEALQVVQKEVTAPSGPVKEQVFFDGFDGDDLGEHWVVNNPDPDVYLVEKGNLLVVSGGTGGFGTPDGANILQFERDLPEGDWDIHVTFSAQFKTLRDVVEVGLRTDDKNFLSASLYSSSYNTGSSASDNRGDVVVSLLKVKDGEQTSFVKSILPANTGLEAARAFSRKGKLTLSKRDRSYIASYAAEGDLDSDGKQIIFQTDSIASLRSPGKLMLSASKWAKANGEFQANIDSFEIETVKPAP